MQFFFDQTFLRGQTYQLQSFQQYPVHVAVTVFSGSIFGHSKAKVNAGLSQSKERISEKERRPSIVKS